MIGQVMSKYCNVNDVPPKGLGKTKKGKREWREKWLELNMLAPSSVTFKLHINMAS